MAIWRGVGGSGESTNDSTVPTVTELLVDAEAARDAAAASASSAASSASSASSSASTASTQASNASTSATNAANSASSASTSASNAASSASSASTSASTATTKASEAATSATNAANSATSAASSATTATTKASEASTSATNAASSASSAASSASTATTQASNASTSASNAASSASSAASSAASAAASFDAFDDIYLGAKSTNPTVDNDGDPLSIGDQYFNTVANELRIWNGSSWQAASTVGGTITSLNVTGNTTLGDASSDTITINGTVQPGVIISGSSSSDALRITQTGAGNALLVEDAANPDATPFVIDTDGNAVFGSASTFNVISPQTGTAASTRLQYTTTAGANNSTFAIANWSTSGTSISGAIVFAKSKSGTVGSQTSGIVSSGDRLGLLDFQGSDGTSFVRAARIGAEVDGTPGTGDMPGRLVFSTTADGASATTERMRLDSSGNLGLGVTPSAWSGATASQVKGIALWEVAANNSHFSSNLYYNGTNRIYIASGYATEYAQQSGAHYWSTAASGTAGGTVSLTTAMTLDASGNLLVNTSSAVSGSKLVVASADATIYGITVGRGAGAVSSNTAVGASALAANTTGAENAALGNGALRVVTTGSANTGVGNAVLYSDTTGGYNTAVGDAALFSNTTASNNTAVGYQAAYTNTTGSETTFIGNQAGYSNNGVNNTGVGHRSLYSNTTGTDNTASGYRSLLLNTTGSYNTAFGDAALQNNTTASNNTAVGYQSSYSNTTGDYLTSVGWQSLYSNTTGVQNVAMGRYTLGSNTTGGYNTAVGNQALILNTTASDSTALGYQALYTNNANKNTALGFQAGYTNSSGTNNTFIGNTAGNSVTTGSSNTFVGGGVAGVSNGSGSAVTTGSKNTILGNYTGNQGGLDIRTASNYIVLSDGDGNPRIYHSSTAFYVQSVYDNTTAVSANVCVASNGGISRATSALKYKQDIRDLESIDVDLLRPIRYKSKCKNDDQTKDHFGLIADEVAAAGITELVNYGADGEVEGFQYERLTVVLLKEIQSLRQRLAALEAK